ncbi:hypothetical protein [Nonomuraea soli]|uniref:Adenylyl-sulfate kinase n=1 Tax=Nonomuraea soli TaxID=1032476 RepID=A0A7W0CLI6_9ACTN|nr:hypothetical protein [Nonomuraea soli]MBA2893177.1 hypothetical protein [Nonomuraea soli]
MSDARALLIIGTVGAGKTTTAGAVGEALSEQGVPNAVIDLDAIRQAWPAPPDDPFHFRLTLRNLRSLAAGYLEAGFTRLVLAGVIETVEERARLAEAVGAELTVCRLRPRLPEVRARLAHRHVLEAESLSWHLARSGELHGILERAGLEDVVVDVGRETPPELAVQVMKAAGWP